jgi:hypothetical protein
MLSPAASIPKTGLRSDFGPGAALCNRPRINRNLYDLFVNELSSLVAGAKQISDATAILYTSLPAEQRVLREATQQLAMNAQVCAHWLEEEILAGQLDPSVSDTHTMTALLDALKPGAYEKPLEPWAVIGIRLVSAFRKLALQLAVQSEEAAEFGFFLGADALHNALRHWSDKWNESARQLQSMKSSLCAAAYMADVEYPATPFRQFAHQA